MKMRKNTANPIALPSKEQIEAERQRLKQKKLYNSTLRRMLYVFIVVAAVAVLISSLFMPILQVSGDSMAPTLQNGDIIILIRDKNLEPGDLCNFSWNNKNLLKRVVAGPGDWVNIDFNGTVYVNDEALEEVYLTEKSLGECNQIFPLQVPDGAYFVLGDNRAASIDSRSTLIGCVRQEQIIGKVGLRIYPFNAIGLIK